MWRRGRKKAYHAAVKIIHVPWVPLAEIASLAQVLNLLRYLEPYGDSPWITAVNERNFQGVVARRCLIKTPWPPEFREKFRRRCHRKSPVSLFRVKLVRRRWLEKKWRNLSKNKRWKLARVVQLFFLYGFLSKNGGRDEFWWFQMDMDKYNGIQNGTIGKLMEWLQMFEMGRFEEILFLEL